MRITMLALILLFAAFLALAPFQQVSAWTYQDSSWWFGPSEIEPVGNLGITLSYPDSVYQGDELQVAVTLEYIKNENARSNYVLFSQVYVHVADQMRTNAILSSGGNVSSGIIRPGEYYSHLFRLDTSELSTDPGEYAIDLSFSALFSRSTALDDHVWHSAFYYNEGQIAADQLPNIAVLDRGGASGNNSESTNDGMNRQLTVGIKRPYTLIHPVRFSIDGVPYNLTEVGRLQFDFPANSEHEVAVPENIELVDGIQAVFVNWADGNMNESRKVTLDSNKEFFAIYKTQYYLDISSEFGTPKGEGWHDSGSNAAFSIDQLAGAGSIQGFDRWEGDYSSSDPFGNILMDGPKTLRAAWQFEATIIVGILGPIAAVISLAKLLPPALQRLKKKKSSEA